MSLIVDPRVGSGDLAPILTSLGCSVTVSTLEYADCAWIGNGPEGAPILCGVEIKKLNDILNCITTGRFSGHQLPGLVQTYNESWLIVEGLWRPNPTDGVLETFSGRAWRPVSLGRRNWMFRDFEAFMTTVEIRGGIRLRRTVDRNETARTVAGLYKWWTNDDFAAHTSHIAINRSRDSALLVKPTLTFEVAAVLPGLGIHKAGLAAAHFQSVRAMVNADVDEWAAVKGIGTVIAQRVVTEVNREL